MNDGVKSIQQIFTEKAFIVPDYQRGYAWEEINLRDLLEDIELISSGGEHYTGTLVIHQQVDKNIYTDSGVALKVFNVVDGQQRLTTISILLNQIAIEFELLGINKMADGIKNSYIHYYKNDTASNRLTLFGEFNEYFQKHVLEKDRISPKTKTQEKLLFAKDYFSKYFINKKSSLVDKYSEYLFEFYQKIILKLKLTVYEVAKETDVGIIFEVMNNRGRDLTDMEKVKNYLLYLSSKADGDNSEFGKIINKTWANIFEMLMIAEDADENQLLRMTYITTYNYNQKEWSGYKTIKEKYALKNFKGDSKELIMQLKYFVDTLHSCCRAYVEMLAPTRKDSLFYIQDEKIKGRIAESLIKIKRIGNTAPFIPIITAMIKKQADANDLLDVVNLIEKYAFRVFRLGGKRSNAGQSALFKLGNEYFNDKVNLEYVKLQIKQIMKWYSWQEEFENIINTRKDWYGWNGIKYLLFEYELDLLNGKQLKVKWEDVQTKNKDQTIEHILPQTPNDEYWKTKWSAEQIQEATHNLGNLVLTFDNSSYRNFSFYRKKGKIGEGICYANSNIKSERQVAKNDEWTYVEYKKRDDVLKKWIKTRWQVDLNNLDLAKEKSIDEDDDE